MATEASGHDGPEQGEVPARERRFSGLWLYVVVGVPFAILVGLKGWSEAFRSGDAAAFVCGVFVASIYENLIEHSKSDFLLLKDGLREFVQTGDSLTLIFVIPALALFIWNAYFIIVDKATLHPTVDWVQLVAFFGAVVLLPTVRFAFTPLDPGAELLAPIPKEEP